MCLPDFIKFKQIDEESPLIGYRTWRNKINPANTDLMSEYMDYTWKDIEGPHLITQENSGIYAYNDYNYYNYNYYYNYYNNNYSNNYYYYYNYYYNYNYLAGIINQWGKTAIHKIGKRSEFAKVNTIFKIRELDASGAEKFISWIKKFNLYIDVIAEKYKCKTINWQDFKENNK